MARRRKTKGGLAKRDVIVDEATSRSKALRRLRRTERGKKRGARNLETTTPKRMAQLDVARRETPLTTVKGPRTQPTAGKRRRKSRGLRDLEESREDPRDVKARRALKAQQMARRKRGTTQRGLARRDLGVPATERRGGTRRPQQGVTLTRDLAGTVTGARPTPRRASAKTATGKPTTVSRAFQETKALATGPSGQHIKDLDKKIQGKSRATLARMQRDQRIKDLGGLEEFHKLTSRYHTAALKKQGPDRIAQLNAQRRAAARRRRRTRTSSQNK